MKKVIGAKDPDKVAGCPRDFEICGETYTFHPLNVSDSLRQRAFWKMKFREYERDELKRRLTEERMLLDECPELSPAEKVQALRKVSVDYKAEIADGSALLDDEEAPKDERGKALLARMEPMLSNLDNCIEAYERLLLAGVKKAHPDMTLEDIHEWNLDVPVVGSIHDALAYIQPEGHSDKIADIREMLGIDPDDAGDVDEKKTEGGGSTKTKSKPSSDTGEPKASG